MKYKSIYLAEATKHIISVAISQITDLFDKEGIDYCLIGGVSLNNYKLNRATDDIDFLILANDKEKIENLIGIYFKPKFKGSTKSLIWNENKAVIDILYSTDISGDSVKGLPFTDPKKISKKQNGINIITLPKLIEYKLSSGTYNPTRLKDLADIQQLIMLNGLKLDYASKNNFRQDLQTEYEKLWNYTKKEN